MRPWVWRASSTTLITALVFLAAPISAGAASPTSLLPDGASLGEVLGVPGTTKEVSGSGSCTSDEHPGGYQHAAVYRASASSRSLLRLSVQDDLGALSLCRVALHQVDASSTDLPTGEAAVATDACASGSTCAIEAWLTEGRTYDVVLWAMPPEAGSPGTPDADFAFDASIKRPASVGAAVSGHRIKDACTGYHEVVAGNPYVVTATTTAVASGTLGMSVQRRTPGGSWAAYAAYVRPLTNGVASLTFKAGDGGSYRITALLRENDTRLAAVKTVYVKHVTPKWRRFSDGGVRLRVPWYHQQYRLTCEASAYRMAHNFFRPGSIDWDMSVLRVVGIDRRKKRGNRWGNPNKVFVGNPNGRMMSTGYGVHSGPIARAATAFTPCRPAVALREPSRATIARHVASGFPVIVWGAHRGRSGIYRNRWKAWDGRWVTGWSVEHVWVVVGFHGKPWKPTHFIIHDPSGRAYRTISLRAYDDFTKYFRRAVVVRG